MSVRHQKSILFITHNFPPSGGSGIQRIVKLTQAISKGGWKPIILTVPKWGSEITNESWTKEIPPQTEIHRVFTFDPMRIALALRNSSSAAITTASATTENRKKGFLQKLKRIYHICSLPDYSLWWLLPATIYGILLVIIKRPSLILTTAGPYATPFIGAVISRFTGIKLVSDYRDGWLENPLRKMSPSRRRIEMSFARASANAAAGVIGVTDYIVNEIKSYSLGRREQKFLCLTNGFEPSFFEKSVERGKNDKFKIVFTGLFYGGRKPTVFFEAIRRAAESNLDFKENIEVLIAGKIPPEFLQMLEREPLKRLVRVLGYISHEKSLELMAEADILFLLVTNTEVKVYPAKLFEYLAARRFIVASAPKNGLAAAVINRFQAGKVAEPDNIGELAEIFTDCFEDHKAGKLQVKHTLEDIGEFSWRNLEKRFIDFMRLVEGE